MTCEHDERPWAHRHPLTKADNAQGGRTTQARRRAMLERFDTAVEERLQEELERYRKEVGRWIHMEITKGASTALQTLQACMHDPEATVADKIRAADKLLDRFLGKAGTTSHSETETTLHVIVDESLRIQPPADIEIEADETPELPMGPNRDA
jgi:hypothetical protein